MVVSVCEGCSRVSVPVHSYICMFVWLLSLLLCVCAFVRVSVLDWGLSISLTLRVRERNRESVMRDGESVVV